MLLVSETNLAAGTINYELHMQTYSNFVVQYYLASLDSDNTIGVKFFATLYRNADKDSDIDWVNITNFLTSEDELSANNETLHDLTIADTHCHFAKFKVKLTVANTTPNNEIKIAVNRGR